MADWLSKFGSHASSSLATIFTGKCMHMLENLDDADRGSWAVWVRCCKVTIDATVQHAVLSTILWSALMPIFEA